MHRVLVSFICLLFFFVTSCSRSAAPRAGYFDSLIVRQVALLSSSKAGLLKTAQIGLASDEATLTPDASVWENELDIFRQLDAFQKPAYSASYTRTDKLRDPASNLLIRLYQSKGKVPVKELKFFYHREFKNLKKIEALYAEENSLYHGERKMLLEFDEINGVPVLSAYGIRGIQKMILGDTIHFAIQGTIRL